METTFCPQREVWPVCRRGAVPWYIGIRAQRWRGLSEDQYGICFAMV